jgi:hypothetical protein
MYRCHSLSHTIFSPKVRGITHYKIMKCSKETNFYRVSMDPYWHNMGTPRIQLQPHLQRKKSQLQLYL